jgi:hypothetical protein
MITTHWIIQGKGGVGKSLIASLLAQYIRESFIARGIGSGKVNELVYGYDTDPVNATFSGYEALQVEPIAITEQDQINERNFDQLIERLLCLSDGAHAIIDNGASSFLSFCNYIKSGNAFVVLQNYNCRVLLHTVVTGGQAIHDTFAGVNSLICNFPGQSIVVWQNSYFGPVEINGVSLEQMTIWKENLEGSVESLIRIPWAASQTTAFDLRQLFSRRKTFAEAVQDESINLMARHRLGMFWQAMKTELENNLIIDFEGASCLN